MSKVFKKIAPIALPILGTMIPGVGPVLGGALGGAAGGAVSGGGLKSALLGGALGGAGGYLSGGAGGLLGSSGGTFGPATASQVAAAGSTNSALSNLAAGTGIKGALSGSGLSSLTSGNTLQNLSSFVKPAASIYGSIQEEDAAEKAQKALLSATGRAEAALNPYSRTGLQAQNQLSENLSRGFNPGDLANDPGYQFRLNQGLQAQNKSLAAQGMGQSGAALKAAQEYGQGFAAQEYGNAYDRWLAQNQQLAGVGGTGYDAAGALSNVYGQTGNVNATAIQQAAERKNKTIADVLAGLGY